MSRPRIIGLLLVLLTLLVYLPVTRNSFVAYDDGEYVTENRIVQNGLTWAGIKWAFTTFHASNWHPLTWISHMMDCQLFGLNAGMHHFVNALFHAVNVVLLFALIWRLTGALWPGAIIAALFAWHPLHVESVAWVSERKDVLSTFFGLLALLSYARYAQRRSRVEGRESKAGDAVSALDSRLSTLDYFLALLMFALGLMAKPMLVTLPFVLLLLDYWPLKRVEGCQLKVEGSEVRNFLQPLTFNLQLLTEKLPFFLLSAAACVVTFLAQKGQAVVSLDEVGLDLRLANVFLSYGSYLLKAIWPANLAVIYQLHSQFSWIQLLSSAAALFVISLLVWRARRQCPYLLVGWLWFLGTLVPVIGLVQVGSAAMADRYTYFPLVGIFIAVVFGVRDLAKHFRLPKMIPACGAVLILAACVALTERQLSYWRNDETLFAHAAAVTKNSEIAHLNLAGILAMQGHKTEAVAEYRKALQIEPGRAESHGDFAALLDSAGKPDEALAEFRKALQMNPKIEPIHDNFGVLLVELGRLDEAIKQFTEAARLDPTDAQPQFLTGKTLLRQGRDAEAMRHFREAVRLDPDNFQMLAYLARVLASDENSQVRDGSIALVMASKANALTGGVQPAMLDTLAMAYAELGHFDDAQKAAQDAITLATNYGLKDDADATRRRLQLYKNNQPCRESFTNATVDAPKILNKFLY
ncbi:MAG TPA: tetratricopeptide repeat protein [Verrucomicrobiae bacterium]|jgi:Tfp pilus assembly protein PilF